MNGYLTRALVALLLAAFLFFQARATSGQPHRRRAFLLAAAALLTFAGYNGALAAGAAIGPLQVGLAIAGMALFVGAVASLVLSWSAGELRAQRDRIAAAAREYRERRSENEEPETRNRQ
jgi:hypothetical protein